MSIDGINENADLILYLQRAIITLTSQMHNEVKLSMKLSWLGELQTQRKLIRVKHNVWVMHVCYNRISSLLMPLKKSYWNFVQTPN